MAIVNSIIGTGGIPVIETKRSEGLNWNLTVKPAKAQLDYTAISHVWTDGFADPRTNGLFACQLSRILQDVQMIRKETSLTLGLFETDYKRPEFAETVRRGYEGPVIIWMDALYT